MAYEYFQPNDLNGIFPANADLSAKQYYIVKKVAGPAVDVVGAATDVAMGVLQNNPAAAQPANVLPFIPGRVSKCVAGDTSFAEGDLVMAKADGTIIKAAANAGANYVVGQALETPSAAGVIVPVLFLGYAQKE